MTQILERSWARLALASVAAAAAAHAAVAQQDYFSARQFPGPRHSQGICTGDWNHDGAPDVATADGDTGMISTLFGSTSGGGFSGTQTFPIASASGTVTAICCADFNHDGSLDLAVTVAGPDVVEIWINDGTGNFNHGTTVSVGAHPTRIASGRLDSLDSNADLVVLCAGVNQVWVLRGNGTGGFNAPSTVTPFPSLPADSLTDMSIGDMNQDGRSDCAIAYSSGNKVWLAEANISGTLVPTQTLTLEAGALPESVAVGDHSGDGKGDLFVLEPGLQKIRIFKRQGTSQVFVTDILDGNLASGWKITLGDFNADGKLDCGVGFKDGVAIRLYYQFSAGVFADGGTSDWLPVGPGACGFAYADFDGNGSGDVAAPSSGAGGVTLVRYNFGYDVQGSGFGNGDTNSAACADFDGDGNNDVIGCDAQFDNILQSYGNGSGGFGFFGFAPHSVGSPWQIVAADFDGDGRPDVATANRSANCVGVLRNSGGTSLASPVYSGTGTQPVALAVGDVNLDGIPDLIVANSSDSTASVLIGTGGGVFTANPSVGVSSTPYGVAIGDLDEDGLPDFVTAGRGTGALSVCIGTGGGTFAGNVDYPLSAGATSVALGDMNRTGHLSAVAVSDDATLTLYSGDGSGLLGFGGSYSVGDEPTHVAFADVTGDGRADAVVSNHGVEYQNMGILANDGSGGFLSMTTYALYHQNSLSKYEALVTDMNGDGQADIQVPAGAFMNGFTNKRPQQDGLNLVGTGTSGCRGRIGMSASGDVHIGERSDYVFTATNVPARSLGLGIVTNVEDLAGSDVLGIGILLHVDLFNSTELQTLDFYSDASGAAIAPAPIPNVPALSGKQYYLQSIWVEPATACRPSIYGLSSSKLLEVAIP